MDKAYEADTAPGAGFARTFARTVWQVMEPVHAVTYFAPESRAAHRAVGLRGFWMGYFAARAAPLGAVAAGVVEAAFYNFHPAMVRRAIPDAWGFAAPEAVLKARTEAAAAALRRVAPSVAEAAAELLPLLGRVVGAADGAGRPLFAANRGVTAPEDPVGALWQATTALREHRGDGHVALLAAEGLDGCEVHVLFAASEGGAPTATLRENRGWTEDDWRAATDRLAGRGLLDADRAVTAEGRALRAHIEDRTDALAVRPYRDALSAAEADRVVAVLGPLAGEVLDSGTIPFPNPMGLPARRP
ncbi:SCO6745 family protein [Streptomyces sp. NPDC004788]